MTPLAMALPAVTASAPAELNDLMRALARTFDRAQHRFAVRQEQLLDSLRPGGGEPVLRVKLPSGQTAEVSHRELCTTQRKYVEDMVVDLVCAVQEVETPSGARLGLRLLPRAARQRGAYPVRLSFNHSDPIQAELRFANQIVRCVHLRDAELPSQEVSDQAQRAQVYLLDPKDVAQVRARAAVIYAAPPADAAPPAAALSAATWPEVEVVVIDNPSETESVSGATSFALSRQSPALPERPAVAAFAAPLILPLEQPAALELAPPVLGRASVGGSLLADSEPAPVPGLVALAMATPPVRRKRLRNALTLLMGLLVVAPAVKFGPPLLHKIRALPQPPVQKLGSDPVVLPANHAVIANVDAAAPMDAHTIVDAAAPMDAHTNVDAAAPMDAHANVDAAALVDTTPMAVRFFYSDKAGVTSFSCDGHEIPMQRLQPSRRSEAMVFLRPSTVCKASSADQVRVYTYDELKHGDADAKGERVRHIRFHKH